MAERELAIVLRLRDELSRELNGVQSKLAQLDPTFKKMAAVGAAGFAAVSAAGIASVRSFEQFNLEIERAGAFVNATQQELQLFRTAAMDAARGTQFSFEQAAAALGNFVGGEIDAKTAAAELGSVIDLALVAKIEDLQQAVDLGSLALTVFKDHGMEMADVIDIIATVASDVTTETDQWATAIVNSAGAAKAAGLSFKDLNVIFSAMKRGGADVNLMWAAFNAAVNRIQAPTKQTIEALEAVGLNVEDLGQALREGPVPLLDYLRTGFNKANESGQGFAFLAQVIGQQAAPEFALALGLTNEELQETAGWFEDIEGRGAEMTDRIRDAIPATQLFAQSIAELNLKLGQALEPALRAVMDALQPIIHWVTKWIEENPKLAATIIAVTAGALALSFVIGTIGLLLPAIITGFTALAAIFAFIAANPIVLLIAGFALIATWLKDQIAALYGVEVTWKDVWGEIRDAFGAVVDWIGDKILWLMDKFEQLKQLIASIPDAVRGAIGAAASTAAKITIPGISSVSTLFKAVPFAEGGIVTRPTLGLVGEAGPEAIIPLDKARSLGGGITINVYGDVSGTELIEKVKVSLARELKLQMAV